MIIIWLKFIICIAVILFSGMRVARYGDVIAEKTGLGGLWIGVILVAIATSLPEIFTGVGSTVFVDAPDLAVGNLFGANTYNLLNIAILDFFHRGTPLLSSISAGQVLTSVLSIIPLLIAILGIFLSSILPQYSFLNISLYSWLILFAYIICIRSIFKFEKSKQKILNTVNKEELLIAKYANIPFKKACFLYLIFAVLIAGAGIWLSFIGREISDLLGLSQNFIGVLFLGFATTLPEITVSVVALRLGAKEMAVANMLGSNLFNMLIIFINDCLYQKAPIFTKLSKNLVITGFIIIIMTAIVVSGLILKSKKKLVFGFSNYAIMLIIIFFLGVYINYIFGINS